MNLILPGVMFSSGAVALLFDAALKSLVVLALAILAARGMRGSSAAARHLVLFTAIAGLLILPVVSAALPGWHLLPRWMDFRQASAATEQAGTGETLGVAKRPRSIFNRARKPIPAESKPTRTGVEARNTDSPASAATVLNRGQHSPWRWGLTVWLAGAFCVALPTIFGLFSLWRLERSALKVTAGAALKLVQDWSVSRGGREQVTLLYAEQRRMPMTWGVLRPKLLLPSDSNDWSEERRRVVIRHELAHVQRWDYLSNLITQFACALYWFNPLVWLAARQLRVEQEQACDDIVLAAGIRPTFYAEEVLKIAADLSSCRFAAYGAVAVARSSSLEGRLLAILDGKRNHGMLTRSLVLAALGVFASVIVPVSMMRAAPNLEGTASSIASASSERARGLVAWWPAEGNGKDSVGGHDGQFPFGSRFTRGLIGQAFDFRRSYAIEHVLQRVSIPDSADFKLSDALTLEAWVYPRAYGGIILIRGDDRGGFDNWQLDLTNEGNISFVFNAADNQGAGITTPFQLGQWQHVVATFERGEMNLYINSVPVAQSKTALRPVTALDAAADPALGIGNAGGKFYNMPFDGLIDEVRIYNRALSEAEIVENCQR